VSGLIAFGSLENMEVSVVINRFWLAGNREFQDASRQTKFRVFATARIPGTPDART
jgi:hypothetical protein